MSEREKEAEDIVRELVYRDAIVMRDDVPWCVLCDAKGDTAECSPTCPKRRAIEWVTNKRRYPPEALWFSTPGWTVVEAVKLEAEDVMDKPAVLCWWEGRSWRYIFLDALTPLTPAAASALAMLTETAADGGSR